MIEFWNELGLDKITSLGAFWEWFLIQSTGMKVFVGFIVGGILFSVYKMIFYLIPME